MYTARKKIQKEKGLEPSEFEDSVAQAFFDLENGNQELKSELKDLYINNAVQMDIAGNRKAVVIHVPYRLRKAFKKIHVRLVRELEKKFSGKDVVYPAEIVGKRIRYRLDGAKVIKIFLDPKERNNTEYKLETFSAVYRRLCGKDVAFETKFIAFLKSFTHQSLHDSNLETAGCMKLVWKAPATARRTW
uniref:40S ribosomal protein S7 n=1 Tax=Oryza meridionalis TaxID=40149 RepID=A0A0E0CZ88_9ORYZ